MTTLLLTDGTLNSLTKALVVELGGPDFATLEDAVTHFVTMTGTDRDEVVVNEITAFHA